MLHQDIFFLVFVPLSLIVEPDPFLDRMEKIINLPYLRLGLIFCDQYDNAVNSVTLYGISPLCDQSDFCFMDVIASVCTTLEKKGRTDHLVLDPHSSPSSCALDPH